MIHISEVDKLHELLEKIFEKVEWQIDRFEGDFKNEEEARKLGKFLGVSKFLGNCLLNEGIAEMEDIIAGLGSPVKFDNGHAYLGVGSSATGEAATDTGLLSVLSNGYKAMDANYPSRANQTLTFKSTYGANDANGDWREFTVANANGEPCKNLNRKTSNQGTKTLGQTWILTLTVTFA
jgi:hypothetical protein